jgi:hypothetical protein
MHVGSGGIYEVRSAGVKLSTSTPMLNGPGEANGWREAPAAGGTRVL